MPSPFPGMDPYLEHPARWPDVHHEMVSNIRNFLGDAIEPHYFVSVEERVYVTDEQDEGRRIMVPDARAMPTWANAGPYRSSDEDTVALAEGIELQLLEGEIREAYLEIRDFEYHKVVAVIAVISPTNKIWGADGRESFVRKRREVEASSAHYLEIDLLRGGTPLFASEMLPEHDYLVRLSRADRRPRATYWPILLEQRLPVIPVPLKPGDDDARLDLQQVLTESYRRGRYHLRIDYAKPPVPPLSPERSTWARSRVAATAAK